MISCGQSASGPLPQGGLFCQQDADCPQGQRCINLLCIDLTKISTEKGNTEKATKEATKEANDEPSIPTEQNKETTPEDGGDTEPPPADTQCSAVEICGDGLDNNCNGQTDEGCGCKNDQECPKGLCINAKCVDGDCRTFADCGDGRVCKGNTCSACQKNTECPREYVCLTGRCKKAECQKNGDCKSGQLCENGICSDCSTDAQCANGQKCIEKRCQTPECTANSQCSGKVCQAFKCVNCSQSAKCDAGLLCQNGTCIKPQCVDNKGCADGKVCKGNKCVNCTTKADCGSDSLFCVQGTCQKGCTDISQCAKGQVCINNQCRACKNTQECPRGNICVNGACTQQQCASLADCTNQQACIQGQCKACTRTSDCGQAGNVCNNGKCYIGLEDAQAGNTTAKRWTNNTYAENCLGYRKPKAGYVIANRDGRYWIKPAGASNPFAVYCEMDDLDGGGWTLVLKGDGTKSTFSYGSSRWTNQSTFGSPTWDLNEGKSASYHTVPFSELAVVFRTGNNNYKSLILPKKANSLYNLMRGNYSGTNVGVAKWKALVSSASLQSYCRREGFNVAGDSGYARVRIGIIGNDRNNCDYGESFIGFGGASRCISGTDSTIGNTAPHSVNTCGAGAGDNGGKNTKVFGYILVR